MVRTTELLGDLAGQACLDFGTGTGRTAYYLKGLGAKSVLAVDADRNMIAQAKPAEGINFQVVEKSIPALDDSIDLALCAHVFVEMSDLGRMAAACSELYRVLKPGARLIVITTNPESIGADYVSYRYKLRQNLEAGDKITCVVKTSKPFEIEDIYWPVDIVGQALASNGFEVQTAEFPKASGEGWLDEARIAPDVIFSCVKGQ